MAETARNHGKRWTNEEERSVLYHLEKRIPLQTLAAMLGRTSTAVEARAVMCITKMITPDTPLEMLADRYGLSIETFKLQPAKPPSPPRNIPVAEKPWTSEEDSYIYSSLRNGKFPSALERTPGEVQARAVYLVERLVTPTDSLEKLAARYCMPIGAFKTQEVKTPSPSEDTPLSGPEWTSEEDSYIYFMLERKDSISSFGEIAKTLKRTPEEVRDRVIFLVKKLVTPTEPIERLASRYHLSMELFGDPKPTTKVPSPRKSEAQPRERLQALD